eukprot:g14344.t1
MSTTASGDGGAIATNKLGMRRSCDRCSRKKKKCDGSMPCGRCRGAGGGTQCTYSKRKWHQLPPQQFHHEHQRADPAGVHGVDELRPSRSGAHLACGILSIKRCRLSASPATGLVGMQENAFLSDFFACVGFMPLTTPSLIRETMVNIMVRPAIQQSTDDHGDDDATARGGSLMAAFGENELSMNPSICRFWCAVALGALAKGYPIESVAKYTRLATDALGTCSGPPNAEVAEAWTILVHLYGFMGNETKFREYLDLSNSFLDASIEEGSSDALPAGFAEMIGHTETIRVCSGSAPVSEMKAFSDRQQDPPQLNAGADERELYVYIIQSFRTFEQAVLAKALESATARGCAEDAQPPEEGNSSPPRDGPLPSDVANAMTEKLQENMLDFERLEETVDRPAIRKGVGSVIINGCRLSASPATGLVGMQENAFLSDFFACVGFMPLTTPSLIRETMVNIMVRPAIQQSTDDDGDDDATARGGSLMAAFGENELSMNPSICKFWCAVALGALAKGYPIESTKFREYLDLSNSFLDASIEEGSSDALPAGFAEMIGRWETIKVCSGSASVSEMGAFSDQQQDPPQLSAGADERELYTYIIQSFKAFQQTVLAKACESATARGCAEDAQPPEADNNSLPPRDGPLPSDVANAMTEKLRENMLDFERLEETVDRPIIRKGVGSVIINGALLFKKAHKGDTDGVLERIARCVEVYERYPGLCRGVMSWIHICHALSAALTALVGRRAEELYARLRAAYNSMRPPDSLPIPPLEEWQGVSSFCGDFHCRSIEGVFESGALGVFSTSRGPEHEDCCDVDEVLVAEVVPQEMEGTVPACSSRVEVETPVGACSMTQADQPTRCSPSVCYRNELEKGSNVSVTSSSEGVDASVDAPDERCRLSASPATGLVGMQENSFLSDFFACVGFMPLTTPSLIRETMVNIMVRPAIRRRTDDDGDDDATARGGSLMAAFGENKLSMDPSICKFWCAVALGALAKGYPIESTKFREYLDLSNSFLDASIEEGSSDALPAGFAEMIGCSASAPVSEMGAFSDQQQDPAELNAGADERELYIYIMQSFRTFEQAVFAKACESATARGRAEDAQPPEEDNSSSPPRDGPLPSDVANAMAEKLQENMLDFERLEETVDRPIIRKGVGSVIINGALLFKKAHKGDTDGVLERIARCVEVYERYPGLCRGVMSWIHICHALSAALAALEWQGVSSFCGDFHCRSIEGVFESGALGVFSTSRGPEHEDCCDIDEVLVAGVVPQEMEGTCSSRVEVETPVGACSMTQADQPTRCSPSVCYRNELEKGSNPKTRTNTGSEGMKTGPATPPTSASFSHFKLAVLMSWMVAATGEKARPIALARRSSHGFVVSTKCFHQLSQGTSASCSDMQWLRRAPLTQKSRHTLAAMDFTAAAPTAANTWRSSNGGLRSAQYRGQRRMLCSDPRAPSSISGSRFSCGGSSDDSTGGNEDSSTAVLELEPLVERVASALEQRCGVRGGDLVLVLVSGGSDSVALLLALERAAKTFQPALRVQVAHFNHALRGKDSDADQEFVVDMARGLEIPVHVRRWKGVDEGGTGGPGAGMQERARRWRRAEARDILTKSIAEAGGGGRGVIATAHHRDDQTETVLLKALRGAHVTKMQGMAWNDSPFVKPLLGTRKSDLVDFLHSRGQAWREDDSNQVAKYARNRVRLQLIPLLQELAGGARALDTRLEELSRQSLLARQMLEREALRWEQQHLNGCQRADGASDADSICRPDPVEACGEDPKAPPRGLVVRRDEFPLSAFLKTGGGLKGEIFGQRRTGADLPELVREELLHRFILANTGNTPISYAQLQLLMRQVDGGERTWSLSLGGDHCLRRVGDFLRIEHTSGLGLAVAEVEAGDPYTAPVEHHIAGAATAPWRIVVTPCQQSSAEMGGDGTGIDDQGTEHGMVLYNLAAGTQLHVRRRKDGDRFRPTWRDRPSKLKDFLRGQGVPLHRREEVALICDQDDVVVAVYPSYPGFLFCRDSTGVPPVRVRIEGTPLFCPRPGDRGGAPAG